MGAGINFFSLVKSTSAFKTKGNYPRSLQRFLINDEGDWSASENKTRVRAELQMNVVERVFLFFFMEADLRAGRRLTQNNVS